MLDVVTKVKVLHPYVLRVHFTDGESREVDIATLLDGEVFKPLRDPAYFAKADVDPILGTVVWPNGADIAPEFLRAGRPAKAKITGS